MDWSYILNADLGLKSEYSDTVYSLNKGIIFNLKF